MRELFIGVNGLVTEELERANKEFPLFRSIHEALAVTEEEVFETSEDMKNVVNAFNDIKHAVFQDYYEPEDIVRLELTAINLACEAIQVAAMARKFNMREEDKNESSDTDRQSD